MQAESETPPEGFDYAAAKSAADESRKVTITLERDAVQAFVAYGTKRALMADLRAALDAPAQPRSHLTLERFNEDDVQLLYESACENGIPFADFAAAVADLVAATQEVPHQALEPVGEEPSVVLPRGMAIRFLRHADNFDDRTFLKQALVEQPEDERESTEEAELLELLSVIEPFACDGGVSCGSEEVDRLQEVYGRISAKHSYRRCASCGSEDPMEESACANPWHGIREQPQSEQSHTEEGKT